MKTNAKLVLKDGTVYEAQNFGAQKSVSGEVVFATGMTGYSESLTDPSYAGQILVFTYPLIGNYGVPKKERWESDKVHVSGVVVSTYNDTPSHFESMQTLSEWLKKEGVPLLEIKDTRGITEKLRDKGAMLGKIVHGGKDVKLEDPNKRDLVAEVSTKKVLVEGEGKTTIALIDCGAKKNIARRLVAKGVRVVTVPHDVHPLSLDEKIDGVLISNGPGDPKKAKKTIAHVKDLLKKKTIPVMGICLGNQILALAAGGTTYKLKFGHRGQNQPCVLKGTKTCLLTTQNHGFAVGKIPKGFKEWFYNANDGTNEGIIHKTLPFMSVQFHPEACPGPVDADFLFDEFIKKCRKK